MDCVKSGIQMQISCCFSEHIMILFVIAIGIVMSMTMMLHNVDALADRKPFQGPKRQWFDPDTSSAFRKVKDLQGRHVWRYTSSKKIKMPSEIRLQAEVDPDLVGLSKDEISNKIQNMKEEQQNALCEKIGSGNNCIMNDMCLRRWEVVNDEHNKIAKNKENISTRQFTLVQFNTLAEGLSSGPDAEMKFSLESRRWESALSNPNTYGGFDKVEHPEICLDFNLRKWRLLDVILGSSVNEKIEGDIFFSNPDIIALEEVDNYHSFFQPALHKLGYDSIFIPKRFSPCVKFGYFSDGCALFWSRQKFKLIEEERRQFEKRGQVYIIATLKSNGSDTSFTVGVTHLKAKKGRVNEQDRTSQINELKREIEAHRNRVQEKFDLEEVPIIIAGDFNADVTSEDSTCIQTAIHNEFKSAYPIQNVTKTFSTYKFRGESSSKRTIDYIFYKATNLVCTHTLNMFEEVDIQEPWGLPGFQYPSDHIMIGSRFKFL